MTKKNNYSRNLKLWTVLVFCLIANSSFVLAAPKGFVRVGDLEIVPNLSVGLEFNTNVFSEADGYDADVPPDGVIGRVRIPGTNPPRFNGERDEEEDEDVNYVITPSVKITYPGENLSLDLTYKIGIVKYFDFTNEDHTEQNLNFKLNMLTPSQRFKFGAGYNFKDTLELPSDDIRSEADDFQAEHSVSKIFGSVDIILGKASTVVFEVARGSDEYDDSAFESESTENTSISISYNRKIMKKTSAVLRYRFSMLEYPDDDIVGPDLIPVGPPRGDGVPDFSGEKNSDSDNHSISVGLEWDATAKVSGQALIGFTTKKFDEENPTNNPATANSKIFDDTSDFTIGTNLNYQIRERSSLRLGIKRNLTDSAFANSAFVTTTQIELGYKQSIGKKLQSDVSVGFATSEYDDAVAASSTESSRTDNKITLGLDLTYPIREWIFWSTKYRFEDNSSDLENREFTNHKLIFTVGTNF